MSASTYFAYGSNLNAADLRRWCINKGQPYPLATFLGKAWLPDHQLLFNYYSSVRRGGALNIRPQIGYAVPGILFQISACCREVLHLKERAPDYYQELAIIALDEKGQEHRGFTFAAAPHRQKKKHIHPDSHYLQTVEEGMLQHGLNPSIFHSACQGRQDKACLPLFVYGTLMQGEHYHPVMQPWFPPPVKGSACGKLYHLGNYPGMTLCSQREKSRVHGEIYSATTHLSTAIKELDRIEGFAGHGNPESLYSRIIQEIRTDSKTCAAWLYCLKKQPEAPLIDSGDWRNREL